MKILQLILVILTAALAVLIAYAIADGTFSQAGQWLTSEPWGLVTLADLYLGFLLSAILIFYVERKPLTALIWIIPIPVLGNIWTAIWFIIRLQLLRERLRHR